jgi:hypothetical protein
LEKSGVIDALTKGIQSFTPSSVRSFKLIFAVLVGLYEEPERPANAVDYIKRYMGAPAGVDVEALRLEVEQLKAENAKLRSTVEQLNSKVSAFISL